MARHAGLIAHGGVGGLIVESLLALTVVAVFAAVWLRERRAGRSHSEDERETS